MQLIRTRLIELSLIAGLLSTFSPILCIQTVRAQSSDTSVASVNGKYSDLIQVVSCPNDRRSYGEFYDWGYWGGTSWCGQPTQPGYWVWVHPNWYIWRNVGIARPTSPTPTPPATRLNPMPYPQEDLGSLDYYEFRRRDFRRRNPGIEPPDYYQEFGHKYLNRFMEATYPNLTPQGQEFLRRVGRALQQKIEDRLNANPQDFAELERNSSAFRKFAYRTHPDAYCSSGWGSLPESDRDKIIEAVDRRDLYLSIQGIITGTQLANRCGSFRDALPW